MEIYEIKPTLMEKAVAYLYKEKLVSNKNFEHLWEFSVELSELDFEDINSYYFIDKEENFWFEAEFFIKLLSAEKIQSKDWESKYVDKRDGTQVKVFKLNIPVEEMSPDHKVYEIVAQIIKKNKRWGAPRKYYKTGGEKIKISISNVDIDPNQMDLLDLITYKKGEAYVE